MQGGQYISVATPVGEFVMILDKNERVRASGFGNIHDLKQRLPLEDRAVQLQKADSDHPYSTAVHRYFDGDMEALNNIAYYQTGSELYQKVWQAMANILPGKVLSYKELAAAADNPSAVRAAGTACGQNRLILLVPCHRIVRSDGGIGNYLYGDEVKKYLLSLETAHA